MRNTTFEPARPLDTDSMPWIPTGPGKSFRPLRFAPDGWSELMREISGTGERVGPGNYVYEPAGTIEYLGDDGQVIESATAQTQRAVDLAWCQEHGAPPDAQILG